MFGTADRPGDGDFHLGGLGPGGGSVGRRPPVLLLQGFFGTARSMRVLGRRLRRDGYLAFSLSLGGLTGRFNTRPIDELAELVRAEVERIYSRHPGLGPLTVIGHSKGGLVAMDWVKRLGGHRRVRAVVTLGTPHRGTPMAWAALPLALVAPSLLQMRPRSAFLRRLEEGSWPAHVRLASLYSRRDLLAPFPTALLGDGGQFVRNVEVDGSHFDFLVKKRIYAAVLREIERPGAGACRPRAA